MKTTHRHKKRGTEYVLIGIGMHVPDAYVPPNEWTGSRQFHFFGLATHADIMALFDRAIAKAGASHV